VILGYAEIQILSRMPTASGFVSSEFPPAVIGVGLVLGVGLSLLGGIYPALRGAAMQPTEALRHE
jgi:putative ABC transport system permease protein